MPSRVDFYLLDRADQQSRLGFACVVAQKAWDQKISAYLQMADEEEAEQMDQLLWSFQATSFVPHARTGSDRAADSPLLIGTEAPPQDLNQMLISLTPEIPQHAAQFDRVADFILADDADKEAARRRFKAYCDMGVRPDTHNIKLK